MLGASGGSTVRTKLRDFAWFVGQAWGAERPLARRWFTTMVIGALAAPGELWAFGQVADAIQARWNGASSAVAWWWLAFALGCGAAERLLHSTFAASWREQFRERAGAAIQALIYRKASSVDLARHEHPDFYNAHQRVLEETETRAPDGIEQFGRVAQSLTGMLAVVTVTGSVAWYLPLLILLPSLPSLWITVLAGTSFWDALSDQSRERRLATYYASLLTQRQSAEEVRLFGIAPYLLERWRQNYWHTRSDLRIAGFRGGVREVISSAFASLGMLMLCGWFVIRSLDTLSAGEATILVGAILTMPGQLFFVGRSLRRIGETSGYASDLRAFLSLPDQTIRSSVTSLPAAPKGYLAARGITFTYPGGTSPVLEAIDLEIQPGERVAIVGENGAGKTTLVKVLLGLYTPDAGTVTLDGADVHALPPEQRHAVFSAVFQQFVHYPWSLQENVTLGTTSSHRFAETVQRSGLEGIITDLPHGAETVLVPELGGADLSGGQWQRVAIARAAWRDAVVLVLDEPTAALDPIAEVEVFRRFAALTEGTTTLFISHRLGMARLADRVVVIANNRIAAEGTHQELRERGGLYAAMWAMQAKWYA